jgi:hypothetical protein
MFTTRSWSSTTALLCALLLQNCQSNSVATKGEGPAASTSSTSAMRQHTPSEPLAMPPSTSPNAPPAAPASSSSLSTTLASEEVLSVAPLDRSLSSPARPVLATVSNSPTAPYDLSAATRPEAPHALLLGTPGHASSSDGPRVCGSKAEGALREMPGDEEEGSEPLAQQRSTNLTPEDDLASRELRVGEQWEHRDIRRDVLNIFLAMAGSEPDEAAEFLDVLLVAAQDKHCRQQALEALGKVAQASPAMLSACLPSLRAAANSGDKNVCLLALRMLGEVEWRHYFGDIEPAPDLPSDIGDILDNECPFWSDKKVRDTHLLVLMPATVNGEPFTLNLLSELIKIPKNGGYKTQYRYYDSDVKEQIGADSPAVPYWLLITRDVLPESRGKTYVNQKELVAAHARRKRLPYELPKVLEAATAILTHYVRNEERLYSDDLYTYTRCQELIRWGSGEYPALVGSFESSGFHVCNGRRYDDHHYRGVAGRRKFLGT